MTNLYISAQVYCRCAVFPLTQLHWQTYQLEALQHFRTKQRCNNRSTSEARRSVALQDRWVTREIDWFESIPQERTCRCSFSEPYTGSISGGIGNRSGALFGGPFPREDKYDLGFRAHHRRTSGVRFWGFYSNLKVSSCCSWNEVELLKGTENRKANDLSIKITLNAW